VKVSEREVTPDDITRTLLMVEHLQALRQLIEARLGGTSEGMLLDAQLQVTLRTVYELVGLLTWTLAQQGGLQDAVRSDTAVGGLPEAAHCDVLGHAWRAVSRLHGAWYDPYCAGSVWRMRFCPRA
jgi:hypothetical protein